MLYRYPRRQQIPSSYEIIAVQYQLFQNGVNCKPIPCSKVCPLCPAVHDAKPMAFRIVNHIIFYTWVWVNTYRYIFSGMNIHLPAILGFTRYQGFDPSPHFSSFFSCSKFKAWLFQSIQTWWIWSYLP